jgi:cell division septation protein DedD
MNNPDFKEKTRTALPGRGFLIMIVIFFSSISFVLGYFVGKNTAERGPKVFSQVTEPLPAPGSGERGQASPEKMALTAERDTVRLPEGKQPDTQAEMQLSTTPAKNPSRDNSKEISHETHTGNTSSEFSGRPQQEPHITYTVQLGALKSASEAKKMRAKLLGKGYRTYIDISTNGKKHEKIYKIRTGEFKDRKEAELLAVKLKNTEGLKTFVTPKD